MCKMVLSGVWVVLVMVDYADVLPRFLSVRFFRFLSVRSVALLVLFALLNRQVGFVFVRRGNEFVSGGDWDLKDACHDVDAVGHGGHFAFFAQHSRRHERTIVV